jgi:hypothetical protein
MYIRFRFLCVIKGHFIVSGTVIVPETPAVSCVKQKSVVTVAESPCSSSDVDSSFGFASTRKSGPLRNDNVGGVLIGRAKESNDHAEAELATDDDSIYEAETQCDVDCLDVNKSSANKLHVASVPHEGKICANAPDQEDDDIFEAETQCEEPPSTVPVKPFVASDPKKQDLATRQDGNIPNEETEVGPVSKAKAVAKSVSSLEQECVEIRDVNGRHKSDNLPAKDMDNSYTKHNDGLHDAPTQRILGDGSETLVKDKTDAVSVCSERTEEYAYDDASLSSHEDTDIKRLVQEKVSNKNMLTQRTAACSESPVARVPIPDKDSEEADRENTVNNVIYNEESLDRSMLEGDEDLFAFQVTQKSNSKDGTFKSTEKFSVINQEDKSKSNNTNSDDPQTELVSLSKQCTVNQCKSVKMCSTSEASEECTSGKSESRQAQNGSMNVSDIFHATTGNTVKSSTTSKKETAELSNQSGDKIDADSILEATIENQEKLLDNEKDSRLCVQLCHDSGDEKDSEAKSQITVPPVSNSKTVSKLFEPSSRKDSSETSVTISSENIKTETQAATGSGNAAVRDTNIKKQNELVEYGNDRKLTEPQDPSRQDVSFIFTHKLALISSEKENLQTELSVESKDKDTSDDADVFLAPTQTLFPLNKNRDFTKATASSKKKTAVSSNSMKVHAFDDHDHSDDDSIFEAETQIVGIPNRSGKDVTEPFAPSPVEGKLNADHDDDDIYEVATQIVGTLNTNNKDSAELFTSCPEGDKTDSELDGSDSICEAATQIVGTRNKISKDFTECFAPSTVGGKINTGHNEDDDDICEAATQIVETSNKNSKDFDGPFTSSPIEDKTNAECGNDDFIFEAATQIMETRIRKPGLAESKRQKLSLRDKEGETVTTESKESYNALAYVQGDYEKSVVTKSLIAVDGTVSAQKAEEAHDTAMSSQRSGSGKPGVEVSKKADVPVVGFQKENDAARGMTESVANTRRDHDGSSGMEQAEIRDEDATPGQRYLSGDPVISDSKKSSDMLSAQKERGQEPEVAGSEILDGPHEDSGDETDPEHVFDVDSREIKVERNSNQLSAVQTSALPISSVETARKVGGSEEICTEDKQLSSPFLILPQDTVVSSVGGTKHKKVLTRIAKSVDTPVPVRLARISTKLISADSSHSKETRIMPPSDNSDNLLAVQSVECDILTDEKIVAAKVKESVSESSSSGMSNCFITSAAASPLPRAQSANNRDQSLNSDLQVGMPSDHRKDSDQAEKIPLLSIRTESDSVVLKPKYSNIQKENDTKSYPDVNQKSPFIEEADGIVDDTQDLIMPSSQEVRKAVEEAVEQESPFRPEETVPSEEEPDLSPKVGRRHHLPSKRAKVRKRLNTDSRRSDSRRRTLPYEDSVHNDASDVTVRASKQRKPSGRGSVQNGGRNKATDMTSQSRADGPYGEIPQNKTQDIVRTDVANISKRRKSQTVAAKSKGQGKTVLSADLQKGVEVKLSLEDSRARRSSRTKVGKIEEDLSLEQCDKPRGGRISRLSIQVAESAEGNDCREPKESRGQSSIDKNKNAQNSLTRSSRSPRQRKMTWKIQDSLKADSREGSIRPEENPKKRSRARSSNNSQNVINESLKLGTDMTVRPRSASPSKSPSKKLVESSEDSGNDIGKEVKKVEGSSSVSRQQNAPVRRSARQSKRENSVTSATDPSEIESPQRATRQNDRKDISSSVQKWRNEDIFTEPSSKCSKRESKLFPVEKSQRNSTDSCSTKTSKCVSEVYTRASGRKEIQTATSVALMQEQSAFGSSTATVVTENGKQRTVPQKSSSNVGYVQERTRRSVRSRLEDTNTSPSCLKDLSMSESLNASHRTQRGVKRTMPSAEEVSEHSPPKQVRSEKSLCEPLSHESMTENVKAEPRISRTRRKVTSPQKLETTGMAKPGRRERTREISKTEESDKSVTTPRSRKTTLSEVQDTMPKVTRSSRGRGTPQSSSQPDSQKVSSADSIVCKGNGKSLHGFDNCGNKLSTN